MLTKNHSAVGRECQRLSSHDEYRPSPENMFWSQNMYQLFKFIQPILVITDL